MHISVSRFVSEPFESMPISVRIPTPTPYGQDFKMQDDLNDVSECAVEDRKQFIHKLDLRKRARNTERAQKYPKFTATEHSGTEPR